ncbi:MAG: META domain-containing protein [Bacteroidota bacterium]
MKNISLLILIVFNSFAYGQTKLEGSYKLIAIKDIASSHTDTAYRHENGLIVSFNSDTTLNGFLTINSFMGNFYVNQDKVKIVIGAHTLICCDNELSEHFLNGLGQTEKFLIASDSLTLLGLNKILFLRRQE